MEFTINKENTDKLKELTKVCQSIADMTVVRNLYEFVARDGVLEAIAYGNGNILSFKVDITNFTHDDVTGYFYIDILQFIQAIEKVFSASGSNEVSIKVEKNKLTVYQGKSKIVINMIYYLDEEEYKEAETAFTNKNTQLFNNKSNPDNTLKVTSELMAFSDSVGKFITMMNRKNVSGFSINGDQVYYSDQALTIMKKKLSYTASNKQLFLAVDLFSFFSNLAKFSDFDLIYTDDGQYTKLDIPELRLQALLVQPSVVAEFPTDDELSSIIAANDNDFNFEIDIPTLLSKCNTFDGIFPAAQWKWKTVDFTFNKSSPDIINLYHSSDTAEVDTDLPIINSTATSTEESVSFKVTTLLMSEYISKFSEGSDGKVYVNVSPLSVEEEHGIGIKMLLKDPDGNIILDLVLSKIYEDDVF